MTNQNEIDSDINGGRFDDAFAVVEAFLDGERVDSQALKAALADAAAREHFVDLVALREAVGSMGPGVWRAGSPCAVGASGALVRRGRRGRGQSRRGILRGPARDASAGPPSSAVEAIIQFERRPAAPTPTQVISLRPGINWTENSGGH